MNDDYSKILTEEIKNRSSIFSSKRQLAGRANNFVNSGNKIAVSDNDGKLTRASITSYGSGNIRTNTSSGSRWKRDTNINDPIENINQKIALSNLEKSDASETTTLGVSSNNQCKRNIISDMNVKRMSYDKGKPDKEFIRGFMK